jgi:hypothetical protein
MLARLAFSQYAVKLLMVEQIWQANYWHRSNLIVYFSSDDDNGCEPATNHPGFTVEHIPIPRGGVEQRGCYNLADLFAHNFSNVSTHGPFLPGRLNGTNATNVTSTINGTISTANAPNRLNVSIINTAAWTIRANYSRIWYQQTNESMYDTTEPGEVAARLLTVYPERNCRQSRGYPPWEFKLAPVYVWTCQSEASGECYSTSIEIQSFQISSAATYGNGRDCVAMEKRGSAEELKPGYFLSVIVGFMVVLGLTL